MSRSWFYKHKDRKLTLRESRRAALAAEVRRLFRAHRGTYGSPRITADLREAGWKVSKNTVAAIMREQGVAARQKKKRRATTRQGKGRWRTPDLVKRVVYDANALYGNAQRDLLIRIAQKWPRPGQVD